MNLKPFFPLVAAFALAACESTPLPQSWKPPAPPDLSRPLTLSEAVDIARASDIRAAAWKARFDAARAGIASAKEIPNPVLSVTWEDIFLRKFDPKSLGLASAQITYPIFAWWLSPPKIDAARATRRGEIEAKRAEDRALAAEIGAGWFQLAADAKHVESAAEVLAVAQEAARFAEKARSLGLRSDYEVDRANTDILQAESDAADAANRLRVDQLAFAFALGADRPAFPTAVDPSISLLVDLSAGETVPEDLLAATLAADPNLSQAKASREAAEANLHAEQRDALPLGDFNLVAGAKYAAEGPSPIIGIEAEIPIFNWNGAGKARATAELAGLVAEEEKARRAVVAGVTLDWERARAAAGKWTRFSQPLAERLAKTEASARRLFDAGQVDYDEYLQARRDLAASKSGGIDAWADAATAGWTLECALGQHDAPPAEDSSEER